MAGRGGVGIVMEPTTTYTAMCVIMALTIIIMALVADGWDGWR